MSCYEWERGRFVLPSKEVAAVKKALRDVANSLHEQVRTEAVRLHKSFATTSRARYIERLNQAKYQYYSPGAVSTPRQTVIMEAAFEILDRKLYESGSKAPGQPTVADIGRVASRATNRTDTFHTPDLTISVLGREVVYEVPENNHARDRADQHPLAVALFAALERITWTRGTGGVSIGNDEYNRDVEYEGGGGNYRLRAYGPLGQQQSDYVFAP